MPAHGGDHWWTITPEFPTEPVAGEVLAAIEQFALPEIRQRAAQEAKRP
jgi:hypothetical protein